MDVTLNNQSAYGTVGVPIQRHHNTSVQSQTFIEDTHLAKTCRLFDMNLAHKGADNRCTVMLNIGVLRPRTCLACTSNLASLTASSFINTKGAYCRMLNQNIFVSWEAYKVTYQSKCKTKTQFCHICDISFNSGANIIPKRWVDGHGPINVCIPHADAEGGMVVWFLHEVNANQIPPQISEHLCYWIRSKDWKDLWDTTSRMQLFNE